MCCCQTEVLRVNAWLSASHCLPCWRPLFMRTSDPPAWVLLWREAEQNAQLACSGSKPQGEWKLCYHKLQRPRIVATTLKLAPSLYLALPPNLIFKGQQSSLKNKSNLPETYCISVLNFGLTDMVPPWALAFFSNPLLCHQSLGSTLAQCSRNSLSFIVPRKPEMA